MEATKEVTEEDDDKKRLRPQEPTLEARAMPWIDARRPRAHRHVSGWDDRARRRRPLHHQDSQSFFGKLYRLLVAKNQRFT